MIAEVTPVERTRDFNLTILGRTVWHLGSHLYKRRDLAIVELVANCWDAGATRVDVQLPDAGTYSPEKSEYVIEDNGGGMTADQVENEYLVVGRNRRLESGVEINGRPIMGKKGVGKLAGFGIANELLIETWTGGETTSFPMTVDDLKAPDGTTKEVVLKGILKPTPTGAPYSSGTRITMKALKHKTSAVEEELRNALGRRFSRIVRGKMTIYVNGVIVTTPSLDLIYREPADLREEYEEVILSNGKTIQFNCGFTDRSISTLEMRGFAIYVHGKTAQAPPFFFNVEKTASGQHGTKYVTGEIHADFLDDHVDDDEDIISTDRQELDWDTDTVQPLRQWGDELSRRLLRDWAKRKQKNVEDKINSDEDLVRRLERLDPPSQKQFWKIAKQLAGAEMDVEHAMPLVSSLLQAFEYRHFHDLIEEIELRADEDPEQLVLLLGHLQDWKVLESRAILEIINGRLSIIKKFHQMTVNNAAETAGKKGDDNMHDLIGRYPWLLNPEWQVLSEERQVSQQLKEWDAEWNAAEIVDESARERYDFLALADSGQLVVVEIKRSFHSVRLDELQRLERYKANLSKGTSRDMSMVMICGDYSSLDASTLKTWEEREDGFITSWGEIYDRTRTYYEHYRAVLEADVTDPQFDSKRREVAQTREVIANGSVYRGKQKRVLGPQDKLTNALETSAKSLRPRRRRKNR